MGDESAILLLWGTEGLEMSDENSVEHVLREAEILGDLKVTAMSVCKQMGLNMDDLITETDVKEFLDRAEKLIDENGGFDEEKL
jgi:hypothetical protein